MMVSSWRVGAILGTIWFLQISSTIGNIVNGGNYRIRSMYDGLYATAGHPSFQLHGDSDLGNITAEKWGHFREQRWDVIGLDQIGKEYWIFSQENTFNKITATVIEHKPERHISQLIPVAVGTYLIRSSVSEKCLENPGYGLPVLSVPCHDLSVKQRWDFDLLTKQ